MELWQERIVTSHRADLIKLTNCNKMFLSILIANEVLSQLDCEFVEAERTNLEKSSRLYDIATTRSNSFPILANALQQTQQTGAYNILRAGLLEQADQKLVLQSILHLPADKAIVNQMNPETLKNVISNNEKDYVENIILSTNRSSPLTLYRNTLPQMSPFYIPRSISNGILLRRDMFREKCDDIFVFKGIEHHELSKLANGEPTAGSTSQTEVLDRRFILLEDDMDFDDICSRAAVSNNAPVHLINVNRFYSYDVYMVEKTNGKSNILWNYVSSKFNDKRCFLSEDEFVKNLKNCQSRGFCICDSPGMGKSWVLGSVARKMAKSFPSNVFVFIPLSRLSLRSHDMIEPLRKVLDLVSSGFATELLLAGISDGTIHMDLFFDGFDEVEDVAAESTIQFIVRILKFNSSTRVFVTSRPHMQRQLEIAFNVIAYDILPFSQANQICFFEAFWLSELATNPEVHHKHISRSRLREFSEACQKSIQKSVTTGQENVFGIPLQCYLFAKVHLQQAKKYATRPAATLDALLNKSLNFATMLQLFMDMSFSKGDKVTSEAFKVYHVWQALSQFSAELSVSYQKAVHVNITLSTKQVLKYGILEICYRSEQPKLVFVHRTFAEYLIAGVFCELCFTPSISNEKLGFANLFTNFFLCDIYSLNQKEYSLSSSLNFKMIFSVSNYEETSNFEYGIDEPVNPLILILFNAQLKSTIKHPVCEDLLEIIRAHLKPGQLFKIFIYCAKTNQKEAFVFFKNVLLAKSSSHKLAKIYKPFFNCQMRVRLALTEPYDADDPDSDNDYQYPRAPENPVLPTSVLLMSAAALFSGSAVLEECRDLYKKCFSECVIQTISKMPVWLKTPLHFAIFSANYSSVEYFLLKENMALDNRCYLHFCLYDSLKNNFKEVEEKMKICNLLIDKNRRLMYEGAYYKHLHDHYYRISLLKTPLATPGINVLLYKLLARRFPEQVFSTIREKYNSLCSVTEGMQPCDIHELCRFLIKDMDATQTIQAEAGFENLLEHILPNGRHVKVETVSMVLALVNKIEITRRAKDFLPAVYSQNPGILEEFLKYGIPFVVLHENVDKFLGEAVRRENLPMLKYLLSKNLKFNLRKVLDISNYCSIKSSSLIVQCFLDHSNTDETAQALLERFMGSLQRAGSYKTIQTLASYNINYEFCSAYAWCALMTCKSATLSSVDLFWKCCPADLHEYFLNPDNELIHQAIESNLVIEIIMFFVSKGIPYQQKNANGNTILHIAVENKSERLVQYILDKLQMSVKDANNQGKTPLHCAYNWNTAKLLLDSGADPLIKDLHGNTFIHNAAKWGGEHDFKNVLHFLQVNYGLNAEAVYQLKNKKQLTVFQIKYHFRFDASFVEENWDLVLTSKIDQNTREVILQELASRGQWPAVNFFLRARPCSLSYKCIKLISKYAVNLDSLETVALLNALSPEYVQKFVLASKTLKMARFLRDLGLNMCVIRENGNTILHNMYETSPDSFLEWVHFIKYECGKECLLSVRNAKGQTAIHARISKFTTPVYLLEEFLSVKNYNIDEADTDGNTLLMMGMKGWNFIGQQGIEAIRKAGARIDQHNNYNQNLMHFAALSESLDAIQFCMSLKFRVSNRKIYSQTPLDIICKLIYYRCGLINVDSNVKNIFETMVENLLSNKEELFEKDSEKDNTLLHHIASSRYSLLFLKTLLILNNNNCFELCFVKNNRQQNPLQIALKKYLISNGDFSLLTITNVGLGSDDITEMRRSILSSMNKPH